MRRTVAIILLTVSLTTLLGLLASGTSFSVRDADPSRTAAAILALAGGGLGVVLLLQVARANRAFTSRIARVVGFQERARELRKRAETEGKRGNATEVKAEADAWANETYQWFRRELPTFSEVFVRPTNAVMGYRDDMTDPANDLVNNLTVFLENLSDILASLVREGGGE